MLKKRPLIQLVHTFNKHKSKIPLSVKTGGFLIKKYIMKCRLLVFILFS